MKTYRNISCTTCGSALLSRMALAACASLLLAACTQDVALPGSASDASDSPVLLSASLPAAVPASATRTAFDPATGETRWVEGDALSVFMLRAGGSLHDDVITDGGNKQFTVTSATGTLLPADGNPLYYPQGSVAVDFIAFYPYLKDLQVSSADASSFRYSTGSMADQTTVAKQLAFDVLHSNNATGISRSKTVVDLNFRHVMSKLKLNVILSTGVVGGNVTAVTLNGMPGEAHVDIQTGSIDKTQQVSAAPISALKSDVAPSSDVDATFTALVAPQAAGEWKDRSITITVDGNEYTGTIPDADAYAADKMYVYTVTVDGGRVIFHSPDIAGWDNRVDHGSEIVTVPSINGVEVVLIMAGTFQMGSENADSNAGDNEKPRHWVRLTKDINMSRYEITRAQYAAFLNDIGVPKSVENDYPQAEVKEHGIRELFIVTPGRTPVWDDANNCWTAGTDMENYPMEYVTWYGAKAYADWIGGRLPTEAEWEYACRAGSTQRYFFGDVSTDNNGDFILSKYAVWNNNRPINDSGFEIGPDRVGTKLPNQWGLYDMLGNVSEWCEDCMPYGSGEANYPAANVEAEAVVDPLISEGEFRILRGGFWNSSDFECRPAYRGYGVYPYQAFYGQGFRVVFPY